MQIPKNAREFVSWVGYTKDIQEAIEKCILCQEQDKVKNTQKFKYVSNIPPHPWHTLRSDLYILLEETGFLSSSGLFLEVLDSEKNTKFYKWCNHNEIRDCV